MRTDLQNLQSLKEKLHLGKMSVLVGSGFSKNASDKFPDWIELLKDLVIEMYPKEFKSIKRIKHYERRDYLIAEKVKEIVSEVGYLDIVSKYINKKGFEESICTYIENNIPLLERDGGNIYIEHKGTKEILDEKNLSVHKELVNLKWNNIYTTNYDQLLDFCVDEHASDKLKQEITKFGKSIKDKQNKIDEIKNGKSSSRNTIASEEYATVSPTPTNATYLSSQDQDKIKKLETEINRLNIQIREKEQQKHLVIEVITDETQLALKHLNNIIKLHGSIRTKRQKTESTFGFSGDLTTHYVISKKHYQSYPEKHEAFMHLMRISLLQESFCLIGFSGDDPNFKAWLSWVKTVLKEQSRDEAKVYFIDLGDGTKISEDKMLFFENNNVGVISLSSSEILKELEVKDCYRDKKALLTSFLAYLQKSNIRSTVEYDMALTNEHEKIWTEIETWEKGKVYHLERLDELIRIKANNLILPLNLRARDIVESIVFTLRSSIDEFNENNKDDNKWYALYAHAVEDLRVPLSLALHEEIPFNLATPEQIVQKVKAYDKIFSGNIESAQDDYKDDFLELMSIAYSFQFETLYIRAKENLEKKELTILCASVISLHSPKKAYDMLLPLADTLGQSSQILLAKKLLLGFYRQATFNINKELNVKIEELKKSGVNSILTELEDIAKEGITKKEKPQLLGKNRHGNSRSIRFTNRPDNLYSIQYVYSLFKLGLQQNIGGIHIISNEDWYKVHLDGYEEYPFAFLFYSLQCSDEDIVKRIAQDYAFNEKIRFQLPTILKQLLTQDNLQSEIVNNRLKSNILIFCNEILISVPPEIWQDVFFNNLPSNINYFDKKHKTFDDYIDLTMNCLQYTTNRSYLIEALEQFLTNDSLETTLKITYGVTSNKSIKLNSRMQSQNLRELLNSLIKRLEGNFEDSLFLLNNLRSILSKKQLTSVKEAINKVDFNDFRYIKILRIIASFGSSDNLKRTIIDSEKLWYSGIKENSYGPDDYILLSQFRLRKKKLIDWNQDEILEIYEKLIPELDKIRRYLAKELDNRWGLENIKGLLREMLLFLSNEAMYLENVEAYNETLADTKKLFFEMREFENLHEGLYSDNESVISDSLRELDYSIYYSEPSDYIGEIDSVLKRIMLEAGSKSRIEQCLFYIDTWLKRDNLIVIDQFVFLLLNILKKYSEKEEYMDYDVPFLYKKLISIAEHLENQGQKDKAIEYWLNIKKEKRFNNI